MKGIVKKLVLTCVSCLVVGTVAYAEQIPTPTPVTDCKATLEAWGNPPNCYCPCDTCRPVCTEPEKPEPEKDKQSMVNLYAESSSYDGQSPRPDGRGLY